MRYKVCAAKRTDPEGADPRFGERTPSVPPPSLPTAGPRWRSQHLQFRCWDRTSHVVDCERDSGHLVTWRRSTLLVPLLSFVSVAQSALPLRRLSTEHILAVSSGRARPAGALRLPVQCPTPRGLHDTCQVVGFKRLCGRVWGGLLFLLQRQKRRDRR